MNYKQLVAIVDDDPVITAFTDRVLQQAGYATRVFHTAEEFLDSFVPHEYDCILLDMTMPGMSGYDLQCNLNETGIHLPILFLTADADLPTASAIFSQGAVDIVQKPVEPHMLVRKIKDAISNQPSI